MANSQTTPSGRAAVANPFLCDTFKGRQWRVAEKNEIFKAFHDALYARYSERLHGPSHLLNRMKALWAYFEKSFEQGGTVRKKINKAQKIQRYEQVVNDFFNSGPVWR